MSCTEHREPPFTDARGERLREPRLLQTSVGSLKRVVLVCPDSFKGTLTAWEAAHAMANGVRSAWPDAETTCLPLADGGEGTLDALAPDAGRRRMTVIGPDSNPVEAEWGRLPDGTGVVEMAQASGLLRVAEGTNDLRTASTYGTGELIREAIQSGCDRLIIGIGGSATNDGGKDAMQALGARFLDADGHELERGGGSLIRLDRIDLSDFIDVSRVVVTVACDVDNPLCGRHGATHVYGPQKGGSPSLLRELEKGMRRYAEVLKQTFGEDIAAKAGAGAAGGLGAALIAFMQAGMRSGAQLVMDSNGFDKQLEKADLVLTGEGRVDDSSLRGKAVAGVLERVRRQAPVGIVCGTRKLSRRGEQSLRKAGACFIASASESEINSLLYPAEAVELATLNALLNY